MPIAHEMWIHGHSLEVEHPERVSQMITGSRIRISGDADTSSWLHLAIPTTTNVEHIPMHIESVMVRYKTRSGTVITDVNVYDGETIIASDHGRSLESHDFVNYDLSVPGAPEVIRGVGISIKVEFGSARTRRIDIASAGARFIV